MKSSDLLRALSAPAQVRARREFEVTGITVDSRQVQTGFCFIAIPGNKIDGRRFIADALQRGAGMIVSETADAASAANAGAPDTAVRVSVPHARQAAAVLAAAFYGEPGRHVKTLGITGTNGKTTTAFLLEHLLLAAGHRPGLLGTIWYKIGGQTIPASHTTPDAVTLQRLLADMHRQGHTHAVMEVSSHALDQGRVWGIPFATAVFTNLTQDHLDYHQNLEQYFQAKAILFRGLTTTQWAVLNADDPSGRRLAGETHGRILWYGIDAADADIRATELQMDRNGIRFQVQTPQGEFAVVSSLIGRHNVYNILAASAAAFTLGIGLRVVAAAIPGFVTVPGRLERVVSAAPFDVFVDYAHTDDALQNVLSALRELAPRRLLVVFGCGGDRDRGKRPKMGRVAATLADWVALTSDNPRSEDPESILAEIRSGFPAGFDRYAVWVDRQQAIAAALQQAQAGDMVLIAGKGHETSQIFKDRTIAFDDRSVARALLGA